MTETPEEFRQRVAGIDNKFYEDVEKRAGPFRNLGIEYEKFAVDYSNKSFQTVTYLNGGALVAIPTALAFFRADVSKADILLTAGLFVLGLLFVVLAQAAAAFIMMKRAEAAECLRWEQFYRVAALGFPHQMPQNNEYLELANKQRVEANKSLGHARVYRTTAIVLFGASLITFVIGCGWGARTIVTAKERVETSSSLTSPLK